MLDSATEHIKSTKKKRKRRAKMKKKQAIIPAETIKPSGKLQSTYEGHSRHNLRHLYSKQELISKFLPHNLSHLISCNKSPFALNVILKQEECRSNNGLISVPKTFSLTNNPEESCLTFQRIISAFLLESNKSVSFDYNECTKIDLHTQALMDVILLDYTKFMHHCSKINRQLFKKHFPETFRGININDENIKKLLFSVGSPANLGIKQGDFPDIVKLKMCSYCAKYASKGISRTYQKEIDTTLMADYVVESLRKINKELTPEKLQDLCTVIGEILINAEEHSTLKHRFSIGYFQEKNERGRHFGLFKLVILNLGDTIYEKFKSPDCPNVTVVEKMRNLSKDYTSRGFFKDKQFEEEDLWTLYALQQGVTSIAEVTRGSGSIQFIESFFNIKGDTSVDNTSKMTIVSGHTRIVFDGTYKIIEKENEGEKYKMMTFNKSGNIAEMPDKKYVQNNNLYFPGTFISANILLNDDDIKEIH